MYLPKNLARRSVCAFAVLASFYSKSFLLGTLYFTVAHNNLWGKHKSPMRLPIPPYLHITYLTFREDSFAKTMFSYWWDRQVFCTPLSLRYLVDSKGSLPSAVGDKTSQPSKELKETKFDTGIILSENYLPIFLAYWFNLSTLWRIRGSNPSPHARKACALPDELIPHNK